MDDRASLGGELLRVHWQLRARIAQLESTLDAGIQDPGTFHESCLAFCRALRRHHVGEDEHAFEVVRRHAPELGDALDALTRDHEFLDPMLERLEAMTSAPGTGEGPEAVRLQQELAGISAVLSNHLAYEERVLIAALDELEVVPDSDDDRRLRVPLRGVLDDG